MTRSEAIRSAIEAELTARQERLNTLPGLRAVALVVKLLPAPPWVRALIVTEESER